MAQFATVDYFLEKFPIDLVGNSSYPISDAQRQQIKDQIKNGLIAATGEVLLYVSNYRISEQNVPDFLKLAVCKIARKDLDLFSDKEKIRSDYDDLIRQLEKIASGAIALIGNNGKPMLPSSCETTNQKVIVDLEGVVRGVVFIGDRSVNATRIQF